MDGSTAVGARARLVDDFNSNNRVFVFLLTTKVGGLGINLTGADRRANHVLLHTHGPSELLLQHHAAMPSLLALCPLCHACSSYLAYSAKLAAGKEDMVASPPKAAYDDGGLMLARRHCVVVSQTH